MTLTSILTFQDFIPIFSQKQYGSNAIRYRVRFMIFPLVYWRSGLSSIFSNLNISLSYRSERLFMFALLIRWAFSILKAREDMTLVLSYLVLITTSLSSFAKDQDKNCYHLPWNVNDIWLPVDLCWLYLSGWWRVDFVWRRDIFTGLGTGRSLERDNQSNWTTIFILNSFISLDETVLSSDLVPALPLLLSLLCLSRGRSEEQAEEI